MMPKYTRAKLLEKPFTKMSAAEREALSAELDRGVMAGEAKPLSPENRAKLLKAKRHHRAKAEKDKFDRVLVTLPPALLRKARTHVRRSGGTLSGLVQEAVGAMLDPQHQRRAG